MERTLKAQFPNNSLSPAQCKAADFAPRFQKLQQQGNQPRQTKRFTSQLAKPDSQSHLELYPREKANKVASTRGKAHTEGKGEFPVLHAGGTYPPGQVVASPSFLDSSPGQPAAVRPPSPLQEVRGRAPEVWAPHVRGISWTPPWVPTGNFRLAGPIRAEVELVLSPHGRPVSPEAGYLGKESDFRGTWVAQ